MLLQIWGHMEERVRGRRLGGLTGCCFGMLVRKINVKGRKTNPEPFCAIL